METIVHAQFVPIDEIGLWLDDTMDGDDVLGETASQSFAAMVMREDRDWKSVVSYMVPPQKNTTMYPEAVVLYTSVRTPEEAQMLFGGGSPAGAAADSIVAAFRGFMKRGHVRVDEMHTDHAAGLLIYDSLAISSYRIPTVECDET